MSEFKVLMPKMGESVQEATITKWFVKVGDKIEEDDLLFEIATEKVDSEIPSPVDGVLKKIFFEVDAVVPVGELVAIIQTDDDDETDEIPESKTEASSDKVEIITENTEVVEPEENSGDFKLSTRFYSPLVRSIAKTENITVNELESIEGSGANGRVQKNDLLTYIDSKSKGTLKQTDAKPGISKTVETAKPAAPKVSVSIGAEDQIFEMDRVRKLIAEHMVKSAQTAPDRKSVV